MKIALIFISMLLVSCEGLPSFWNDNDHESYVRFSTYAKVPDTYTEIRYFMKEFKGDSLVTVDSVMFNARNKDGTDETFEVNAGFSIGFFLDSVALVSNGVFEAVAVRKDSSLVRKQFGRILDGISKKHYTASLMSNEIVVQ